MKRSIAIALCVLMVLFTFSFYGGTSLYAEETDPSVTQQQAEEKTESEDEDIKAAETDSKDSTSKDAAVKKLDNDIQKQSSAEEKAGKSEDNSEDGSENGSSGKKAPKLDQRNGGNDASAYFHTTITTNKETYTSGETALVSIRYTIDQNTISPGDYVIVTIPPEIASSSKFSVSSQHFSSVEDMGNGQYKLIFGEDAASGLAGSMTVRVTTNAEEETTGTITAGDGEKEITVIGAGSGGSGVGTFENEAIMKDGLGNEEMTYGGYDYSQAEAAQIGIFDSSVDNDFTYRLFINRKNVSMTNVTVTDTLPDGMYFTGGVSDVICYKIDPETMTRTDEVLTGREITISGQTLTVHLGDIDFPVEIEYSVHVPAQTSVKLRNHSEVKYTQDGKIYQESKDYIAQSSDYSAANGIKSVDKTVISDDPSDQWVTYTIRFWSDKSFDTGEINMTDRLDGHVKFLYADEDEYFKVTVDDNDPNLLHISNTKEIPDKTEASVSFVCDFSDVPVGYTVNNSVGGNTTKTEKIGGFVSLDAKKTVDGKKPAEGEFFFFRLFDQNHNVLQTAESDSDGNVSFRDIKYGSDELGKTFTYYISEVISDDEAYVYDDSEYVIKVTVGDSADDDGVIPVTSTIEKNGIPAEEALFNNEKTEPEKISVIGTKTWDDEDDKDGKRPDSITVNLYANNVKTDSKTVKAEDGWRWEFNDLDKYNGNEPIIYTVDEERVEGYQTVIDEYNITNSYTPGKISIPVRKVWDDANDQDGIRPDEITVGLLADGEDTGKTVKLDEANQWTASFSDLDEYNSGNKIDYTVREVKSDGYKTEIKGDEEQGFTVTNKHTPEVISISGNKSWEDKDNHDGKRPEQITVNLYDGSELVSSKTISKDDDWNYEFKDLPKFDKGTPIQYSVREDPVEEYQSQITGFDITNAYTPGKVSIPVTKVWKDSGNQDKLRPDAVTVHLYANGIDSGKKLILNQKNNWTASFTDLDEYSEGKKIKYNVAEDDVPGYITAIKADDTGGFFITNTLKTEEDNMKETATKTEKTDAGKTSTGKTDKFSKTSDKTQKNPKTGDNNKIVLWSMLLLGSFLVLAVLIRQHRKDADRQ